MKKFERFDSVYGQKFCTELYSDIKKILISYQNKCEPKKDFQSFLLPVISRIVMSFKDDEKALQIIREYLKEYKEKGKS